MDVTREVELEAAPADVWELLTDDAELSAWLDEDDRVRVALPGEVEEHRHLAFVWWPAGDEDAASRVDFTLVETDRGTRLTVTETFSARAAVSTGAWFGRLLGLEWRCMARALAVRG